MTSKPTRGVLVVHVLLAVALSACSDSGDGLLFVSAGYEHTCVLRDTGAVRCWGSGEFGQLAGGSAETIGDDETPADASVDVMMLDGAKAVQVITGGLRTCVLLDTATVRCWGLDADGALGDGDPSWTGIGSGEPANASADIDVGEPVAQLSGTGAQACVLLDSGSVRCWGPAGSGQLGYGNTEIIGDDEPPSAAGDVAIGGTVVQLSTGRGHTCVLLAGGAVRCWGQGVHGGLGYGNEEDIGDDETPETAGDVDVGGAVVSVHAGSMYSCAIMESGGARCWGNNFDNQLGLDKFEYGDIGDDELPSSSPELSFPAPVKNLALGGAHVCALLENGNVHCWGSNDGGVLGLGERGPGRPASSVPLDLGGRVRQISAGRYHTCAHMEAGGVRCWGDGRDGKLGYGNTDDVGDDEVPAAAGDVSLW